MQRLQFSRTEIWAAIFVAVGLLVYLHSRRRCRCTTRPMIGSSVGPMAMMAMTMLPEVGIGIWGAVNDANQAEIAKKERAYAKNMAIAQDTLGSLEREQNQRMAHIQNVAQTQQMIANADSQEANRIQLLKDQTNYRNTARSAHIGYTKVRVNTNSLQHMKIM